MPPAFVLSQDQTLRKINFILSENLIQALKICVVVLTTSVKPMSQNEFQGYIALFNFQSATTFFVVSNNISLICLLVKRTFEDF